MSIQFMTAVWQHSKANGGDLLVELAIADFSNDEGVAFPSIATLAKKARLSPRQVKRALQRLMQFGELAILKNQGPHGVNLYRLLLGDKLSRGVTSATARGDIRGKKVVTPMSPNPSSEPSGNLGGEVATHEWGLSRASLEVKEVYEKTKRIGCTN